MAAEPERTEPDVGTALRMRGVSKRFPGTLAVDRVDFEARAGEIHALLGENGAGKTTLMRILAGSFADYTGAVEVGGAPVNLRSPREAAECGIAMSYQELSLAPVRSVAENLLAGDPPCRGGFWLDRREMERRARAHLNRVGLDIDPWTPVEEISQHQAQLVEIARALGAHPCILVLDEPTSALSRDEAERLFAILRRLRNDGLAIVYISHHLAEVMSLADRVTVLRDGKLVATYDIGDVTPESLVSAMIGGAPSDLFAARSGKPGEPILRAEGLSRYGWFHDVSFRLRAGEVLGVAGLAGSGRTELARALCGIDEPDEGSVLLGERQLAGLPYSAAIRAGVVYLTEDRKRQGLALRRTVAENLVSAVLPRIARHGLLTRAIETAPVPSAMASLQIHPSDPAREVASLSGGNQQKVLLAKWLATDPEVLILDEPTRGVDVGAKALIHKAVAEVADRGKGVLLISSDLPELVGLADRILVMRGGHLVGEMDAAGATPETVLLAASGDDARLSPANGAP